MISEGKICAIVAHDAGGAEVVSSYVRRQNMRCIYSLEGPARKVFERKLGKVENLSLDDVIRQADWILCGTSWQSELEYEAIGLARTLGKGSVAFIDHWVNYRERFERNGEIRLPDELWVGDAISINMALKLFPSTPVYLVENPYFLDIRDEIKAIQKETKNVSSGLRVLYVCEPIKEHALRQFGNERHWGYTEEDALRYFLNNIAALGKPVERIVIRQHPSESPNKYLWVKKEFNLPIAMGGNSGLVEQIVNSDVVVGCASMAMVVGVVAEKIVISSIPTGEGSRQLPLSEIKSLRVLIGEFLKNKLTQ
jgi:hypothetical protein